VALSAPHPGAIAAIAPLVVGPVHLSADGRRLSAEVDASSGIATSVVRALDAVGVLVDNIEMRQPSLDDDVFFSLTGGHVSTTDADDAVDLGAARSVAGVLEHSSNVDAVEVGA
jgi:ABC-2 type transport system ATP-binding protein